MKTRGAPSLRIETELIGKNRKAATQALVDSGATGIFMHPNFVEKHGIRTSRTPHPIPVNTVQNTEFKGGPITRFAELKLRVLGEQGGAHIESARFYIAEIGKEDVILGTDWLLEHNPEVDWHAYGLHFTRCPPTCDIIGGPVKAKRAFRKPGRQEPGVRRMVTVPRERDYSIPLQKPEKGQLGRKVGNTTVPHPRILPKIRGSQPKGTNREYSLRTQARNYTAPTWAEEEPQEGGGPLSALPSTDLDEEGVYLVRYLETGQLEALELYNDHEESYDIHRVETSVANTPARKAEPAKAAIGKQTKHTNSQKLAEEASKGKPELSFEEIVPKEYWSYRKVFKGRKPGKLPPKRPWDHKIELKDDMEHSLRPKLYSLSPMEQEELKKFIDDSLKKGFIRESKSHMASP
ncbi:hypothetical protein HETIRDRAFT_229282, partial [Heterobasidion irregulare TC 32-1]